MSTSSHIDANIRRETRLVTSKMNSYWDFISTLCTVMFVDYPSLQGFKPPGLLNPDISREG
jgi:hypothetical protein